MHVLIVEDDGASRKLLERFLQPYGTSTSVPDGTTALNVFKRSMNEGNRFDLICLDIMLPDMDGQLVLEGFRDAEEKHNVAAENRVPVFFTSGLDKPAYEEDTELKKQRVAYLVKPIERRRLVALLKEFGLFQE